MAKSRGIGKVKLRASTYLIRINDDDMEHAPLTEREYRLSTIKPEFEYLSEGNWFPPGCPAGSRLAGYPVT